MTEYRTHVLARFILVVQAANAALMICQWIIAVRNQKLLEYLAKRIRVGVVIALPSGPTRESTESPRRGTTPPSARP